MTAPLFEGSCHCRLARECRVKWVLVLTLQEHISLCMSSKEVLDICCLIVSGLSQRSLTGGLLSGFRDVVCEWHLSAKPYGYSSGMIWKNGNEILPKCRTHLNRIKVICEIFPHIPSLLSIY